MDESNPTEPDPGAGPRADLVGSVLAGRYRIVAKLGEGAMGAVYLGEHLKIGRQDAIKVLRANLAADREAIARFLRGARNVSAIRHPNVCTIYDFSDTDGGVQFLAMEYVPGETLKDLLDRDGTLPLQRAVDIAAQAAAALQAAHDAGIVHRDLKPANIMIAPGKDGADIVKVVDFDIAKGSSEGEGSEVTRHGFVVGTPEYMSPEQLIGEALDGRSDVYSLALVLFRTIAGGLPFRSKGTQDLMIERLTDTPRRLEDVLAGAYPPALEDALALALQRRAADRTPSATEFARQIVAALGPGATAAPLTSGRAGQARNVPVTTVSPSTGSTGGVQAAAARAGGDRSPSPSPPGRRSDVPSPNEPVPPWWRSPIVVGAAAVGLAAVALTTTLIINDARQPDPAPPIPIDSTPVGGGDPVGGGQGDDRQGDGDQQGGDQQGGGGGDDSGTGGNGANADGGRGGGGGSQGGGDTGGGGGGANTGGGGGNAGGGSAIVVSAVGAEDHLVDYIYGRVTASAPREQLIANRDTAEAYWALEDLDGENRARAALIVSSANCYLGDLSNAVLWAERAIGLNPSQVHTSWRDVLRRPDYCSGVQ